MIFGIDWDKTITAEPGLFKIFIDAARERGHTCIIVTGRQEHDKIVPPWPMVIIYAGNEWKCDAALKAGYKVDVWIDDMPGVIMPSQKLEW
jgi:hypothetical protein